MQQVTGAILAGGHGTRMGGADKGLLVLNGMPLIQQVIQTLQPQVDEIIINANRHLPDYQSYGFTVVSDQINDFQGPLAGMQACMQHCTTPYCLFVPCDAPLLPHDLCQRLFVALEKQHVDIAIARTDMPHPVICLLKTSCLTSLNKFLQSGERKVSLWQNALPHCYVDFLDAAEAFTNINLPEQIKQ